MIDYVDIVVDSLPDIVEVVVQNPPAYVEVINEQVIERVVTGDIIFGEVPAGVVDNSNVTFTTAFNFLTGKTGVYYNGVRQKIGASNDYTELDNNKIIFNTAPKKGGVTVDYIKN